MRKIMQEGDLIVAEVHSVNNDKTFNLHTRNPKYGRLEPGILVELAPRQIKRQKHHMISMYKLGFILGNNGNVYLSNFKRSEVVNPKDEVVLEKYSEEMYSNISFFHNLLKLVSFEGLEIS
jgi:exosome complex component RRP4